jgi:hypothetical protein
MPRMTRFRKPPFATWGPWALTALSVLFGLLALHAERLAVLNLNDSAMHAQMARYAADRLADGHLPLSGWYPDLGLGAPHFHHYQSLAHVITGAAGRLVGDDHAFGWALFLLMALWPVCVYAAARLFGLSRWAAAGAALVAPLIVSTPGYGYEHSSYTWQGYGMWTQLWGMWLMPLAWGLTFRAVSTGRRYALAAFTLGMTIALHFLTGYLAIVVVAAWVPLVPREIPRRLGRALLVWAGAAATAAWVIVPLLKDAPYANQSAFFRHTFYNDSYGASKVLPWLVKGELFDRGRLPVVTILVAIGFGASVVRGWSDPKARALPAAFAVCLALFCGRPTFGPILNLLPGSDDLLLHRFVIGVHLAGILLAGIGLVTLAELAVRGGARLAPLRTAATRVPRPAVLAAALLLPLVVLAPAIREVWQYDSSGADQIEVQRLLDETDGAAVRALVEPVVAAQDGRIYAGARNNWGTTYKVGQVPVYTVLAAADADAVGFTFRTASLSTDVEALFDESKPAQYDLFGIRYLLLPPDREPLVPARLVASRGRHRLFEVTPPTGYFAVQDVTGVRTADRTNLAVAMGTYLGSDLPAHGIGAAVEFGGHPAAPLTATPAQAAGGRAGSVDSYVALGADGRYVARVTTTRRAAVVLKESYDPRWRVTVDGVPATPYMVAPSFVAVTVPAGAHAVEFTYAGYRPYWPLFLLGLLALLGLWRVSARRERTRAPISESRT